MKKVLKILAILACIFLALLIVFFLYSAVNHYITLNQPRYEENYYETFASDATLENKFAKKGSFAVSNVVSKSENKAIKNIRIWYPTDMENTQERYPLILVVNGSQCPAKVYEPFFAKLASWGFVVAGNDDPQPGTGASTAETLDFVLNESTIRQNVDVDHIGIIGYSQGGAGAINAVTRFENSNLYKTMFTGSAAYPLLAASMGWTYDESKIRIPYFMTAGTGTSDDRYISDIEKEFAGVSPLASLIHIYDHMDENVFKIRGRVTGAEHEDMLLETESYLLSSKRSL